MINHLTGVLNKCAQAFKRDNHLVTSSSVKQKAPRPSALVFSVSRMARLSVIIPNLILGWITPGTSGMAFSMTDSIATG